MSTEKQQEFTNKTIKTITKRKDGTKRVQIHFDTPPITDQSQNKSADINNIVLQYAKQGAFPQPVLDEQYYKDISNIPSPMDAFNIVNNLTEAFNELHPYLRKQMDNDPRNLPNYLLDKDNEHVLIKYGAIIPKTQEVGAKPSPDSPPVGNETKET